MESLRTEIEQEMMRVRLDKGRLYDLLLKIIDAGGAGPAYECATQTVEPVKKIIATPVKKVVAKK